MCPTLVSVTCEWGSKYVMVSNLTSISEIFFGENVLSFYFQLVEKIVFQFKIFIF